ncbi:MAG: NUDIX hydrolase [Candidatus Limisoma sp.]|nr:NUDIX domain-containing protein [Bacteroidales bacterium]
MKQALKYHYKYPHPSVTTDCVIFGFDGTKLRVLLVERGIEPYIGRWALPGGFLRMDECAEDGALRELQEETGLAGAYIRQFHTFTAVHRDPRERVITIAFYALVRLQEVKGGDDAADARWFALDEVPQLAFDHDQILRKAEQALRQQIHFEPVGFELLPEEFTIKQLQNLYEAILNVHFDRRNFYNKMKRLGMLEQTDETVNPSQKKEAYLFRFNKAKYDELKQKGFRLEF